MKSFKEFLNESPVDFTLNRKEFTQEKPSKKTAPSGKFYKTVGDIDFYVFDNTINTIIDGIKDKQIVIVGVISKADKVPYFDNLWKSKEIGSGVIDSMFFDILIPKYKSFYSGTQQTIGSKAMWKRIGEKAKEFGVYDAVTETHKVISINDMDKYSKSSRYQYYVK